MLIKARDFRVTPHALMFDPQFYIYDFAVKNKLTKFLIVEEQHLDLAPFIDIRFESMAKGYFSLPTTEVISLENQHKIVRPKSSFIFHHAFVCSTLLARCMNQIDAFFSLKEPWILRRLADTKRAGNSVVPRAQWQKMFMTYMMLLAKNYQTGKAPVIKVTNLANNLLPDVLEMLPGHSSLYLYSDLESFLISNLKKPEETQRKMPDIAMHFMADERFAWEFPQYCQMKHLSFLQICALVWVSNLYNFRAVIEKKGNKQVRTLEMQSFLQNPEDSLLALSRLFGHQPTPGEVRKMAGPEVLESNAKQQHERYDARKREAEAKQVVSAHAQEIHKTIEWIKPLARDLGLVEYMESLRLV